MAVPGLIVDLSSNNPHPIDYGAAKRGGVIAAIIKATDGTRYVNPFWAVDVAGFNAVGVPTVGYHFSEFGNPAAEAAHFLAVAGWRARVLDSETNSDVAWQNAFLADLGLPANEELDYGSASSLPRSGVRAMLWPASYGKNPGEGDVWQYTDAGIVPGISGKVDLSTWTGSPADFFSLFSVGPPPAPVPVPPTPGGPPMPCSNTFPWNSDQHAFQVTGGNLVHRWAIGTPAQTSEILAGLGAKNGRPVVALANQVPQYSLVGSSLEVLVEDTAGHLWYAVQTAGGADWAFQELP